MSIHKEPLRKNIREALATYEAFRRLGFTPDEIFLEVDDNGFFVVLKNTEERIHSEYG